jgi:tetratricopeptide (TPR) repeat protein
MDALDFVKRYVALPVGMVLQLFGYLEAVFNLTGIPRTFLIVSSGFLLMVLMLIWLVWFSGSCQTGRRRNAAFVGLVVLSAAYYFFVQYNLLLNVRNDTFRQVMDLESARDLLGSDPNETVVKLTSMTRTLPDVPELYNIRGVAHSKQNRPKDALRDFRKAAELNPKNRQYVYNVAAELSKMCDFTGAKKQLDDYIAKNEDEMRGRFQRGVIHHLLGDHHAALSDYRVVIASRDHEMLEGALFNSAVIYAAKFRGESRDDVKQQHLETAIKYLERSLELGKDSRLRRIITALEVRPDTAACESQSAADDLTSLRSEARFLEWLEERQKGGTKWSRISS